MENKNSKPGEKQHYEGHRQRLKDKFKQHPSLLLDYEIVELMLGYVIKRRDVKPLAKSIVQKSGSLINLFDTKLSEIDGAGKETEMFFKTIAELYSRVEAAGIKKRQSFSQPDEVYRYLKYSLAFSETEKAVVLAFDAKNRLVDEKTISDGVVNGTILLPRQVAEFAIKANAVGVILAHNHPANDPSPSKSDVEITTQIKDALDTLGINLLDHIIVCKNGFTSMEAKNLI